MEDNTIWACLYCGDTMPKPDPKLVKKLGKKAFRCCDHDMVEVDMNEMYKLIKSLDVLKEKIEAQVIEGL